MNSVPIVATTDAELGRIVALYQDRVKTLSELAAKVREFLWLKYCWEGVGHGLQEKEAPVIVSPL